MEKLVNYSSEDEQDEKSYRMAAERGSYLKRASATKASSVNDIRRHPEDGRSSVGNSYTSPPYGSGSNSSRVPGGGGHNHKDEDSSRYKSPLKSSTHDSNRTSSQHHSDREDRNTRDNREHKDNRDFRNSPRDNRDNRDVNNGNRNDSRNDRFNRSREHNRDQRRDHNNYRDTKRPRDDDRNYRGNGNGNQNRNSSSSFSSPHNKDRYKNPRHSDRPTNQRSYQQRSRDERSDNRSDLRSERYERKQRSPDSRSPSPTLLHNKRFPSSRNDSERIRNRGRNSHSRSRSRSSTPQSHKRSPSPNTSRDRVPKPLDQARSTALDLERKLNASESIASEREIRPLLRHTEAVLSLPLNDTPKPPTVIAVAPTTSAEPSVIQLPSYYNPSVINPNKYAEQVQKRKLIWGAKKAEDTSAKWGHAQFSQDSDGKVASKFMRLMGIKGGSGGKSESETPPTEEIDTDKRPKTSGVDVKSREQMFSSMEQQYEVARQVTHTMRGVGLGFSSQSRPY